MPRRKRGRQSMGSPSPTSAQKQKSSPSPEPEVISSTRSSSRKRGRASYPSTPEESTDTTKRRREQSPTSKSDEEYESDTDSTGETKVDVNGNLLGGREYKVPTFTLPEHGDQLLMLAMEPTKALGYRDSYLFFHKHPSLKRVRITEEEKKTLVNMGMLVTWFKHRDVAVVTARSVFKCFGHKIIKRGKRIKDDYYETEHEERPSKYRKSTNDMSDMEISAQDTAMEDVHRKSLITRTVKSEGYASEAPINHQTWMHHAALAARGFNAQLHERRSAKPTFYDIHSNVNQVPFALQSQSCTFEMVKTDTPQVEFKAASQPRFHGIGRELLDTENQPKIKQMDQDGQFPLALMEGQFQANFPLHQARFNYPVPKIPDPSNLIDTAQSLAAQQYYLGLVYQSVNQYTPEQQQQQQQQQQRQSINKRPPQPQYQPIKLPPPEPIVCGVPLGGNQVCKRPVTRVGERCSIHMISKSMSDFAKGPPPSIAYSDNKCADCHELKAADSLFSSAEEHITDDFAVVKCAKCTRKYHPICANLTTPRQVAAVESYPWSCPECKICCVCKSAGDESTLMICDGCDRGWHTGCCNPRVEHVPEGSWLCPLCANCHGCDEHGMAAESQYTHAIAPPSDRYKYPVYLATYCNKCIEHFNGDRFCPVCLKTYAEEENDDEDNEMVACDTCDHWVHTRCDEILTPEKYQLLCDEEEAKYSCPMCEDRYKRLIDTSTADLALKGLSAPSGFCVGLLGGKVKTRGIVKYKQSKVGVPEINGTGIAEMPSN